MRTRQYLKLEREIAAHDAGGIRQRWRFGRLLLVGEDTTDAGNLRDGALDKLIQVAKEAGRKLARREIQYRLQAGRTYPTEAQLCEILARFESWNDLVLARFPEVSAPEGARPYDPRETDELIRQSDERGRRLLPDSEQLSLDLFPKHDGGATLAELEIYTKEQAEITARFSARDARRCEYLAQLVKAAGGDLTKTLDEATALLAEADES